MLRLQNLRYFNAFIGTTPHKGDELCAEVYFADVSGDITTSTEINMAKWTDKPEEYNLSDITQKIVLSLRQKSYL